MKRVLSVALVILLLLSSFAIAESADKAATLVSSITLSESDAVINKGKTLKLTAEIGPAEAKNKKVNWSSTDVNIASVNNGTVSGKACGECDIICEAADGSGVKAVCHVNVIQMVTSLTAKPQKLTIPYGGTSSEVDVKIVPEVVTNPVLVWSSSDESICSVDENGVITAVGAGDCEISCATTDGSDKVAVIKVHVPVFSVSETSVTVTEKDGILIPVDLHGVPSSLITHKASSEANFLYYFNDEGIHVFPIKAGSATITLTDSLHKTDSAKYAVTIDPSAVYDPASGEEEPLRAYVVVDKNVVRPGDKVNAKYFITGGKTPYIQCEFHTVHFGQYNSYHVSLSTTKVKSLPSGSQAISFNDDSAYSFLVELCVVDADGNSVTVPSNIATVEHLDLSMDYDHYAFRRDQPFRMDYQIKGGSGKYHVKATATLYYENGNTVYSVPVSEGDTEHEGTLEYSIPGDGSNLVQVAFELVCQDLKEKNLCVNYLTAPMVVTDDWSLKVGYDKDIFTVGESVTALLYFDGNNISAIDHAYWNNSDDHVSAKYESVDSGVWSTSCKLYQSGYVEFCPVLKDARWDNVPTRYIKVR